QAPLAKRPLRHHFRDTQEQFSRHGPPAARSSTRQPSPCAGRRRAHRDCQTARRDRRLSTDPLLNWGTFSEQALRYGCRRHAGFFQELRVLRWYARPLLLFTYRKRGDPPGRIRERAFRKPWSACLTGTRPPLRGAPSFGAERSRFARQLRGTFRGLFGRTERVAVANLRGGGNRPRRRLRGLW